MKRLIRASAGDVRLQKFILVPMDPVPGVEEDLYDVQLGGYFYQWEYTYNTVTGETDDRMQAHSDVIDQMPAEIRRQARDLTVWGKTDYFKDSIRFIIVNDEYITKRQANTIKRMVMPH